MSESEVGSESQPLVPDHDGFVDGTDQLREQRINDYLNASLAKADAFEANVGVVNADLMRLARRLEQVLADVLDEPVETLGEIVEVMPGIDSYLRVTKQIDRFSQLSIKLKRSEDNGSNGKDRSISTNCGGKPAKNSNFDTQ